MLARRAGGQPGLRHVCCLEPCEQIHHRRHVPAAPTAGEHAARIELARNRPQARRTAGADVRDHRREVPRMPIGVPRYGLPSLHDAVTSNV